MAQCSAGGFNAQSAANACKYRLLRRCRMGIRDATAPINHQHITYPCPPPACGAGWAIARLHVPEHPAPNELVGALEAALAACLGAPRDSDKPNAQAVSSVWHRCVQVWGSMQAGVQDPVQADRTGEHAGSAMPDICHFRSSSPAPAYPYSWGRIASLGGGNAYRPGPAVVELLWERTQRLCLAFDSQGVSNMLW